MNQLADIDVSAGLTSAWENIAAAVPKIVVFLLILIVGYFVARAIEKLLDRLLERVGFDRWVERGGLKRALDRSQLDASRLLGRIVFYALMLVVLATAFGVFGPNPVTAYLDAAVAYLPKLFVALLIIVIAAAIASAVRTIVRASLGATGYGDLLANLAGGIVVALGVFAALNQLEIAPPRGQRGAVRQSRGRGRRHHRRRRGRRDRSDARALGQGPAQLRREP